MHLVVGLGNPGETYRLTRHNVGFLVVEFLAQSHDIALEGQDCFSLWGQGVIGCQQVVLAKPQTFMNRSGQAVAALRAYFELAVEELLVIHDDLDLDFGRLKIVRGGGTGGHRGVNSIHALLRSDRYARLKVGIGRPRFGETVEDYVLAPWYEDQRQQLEQIVAGAAAAVTAVVCAGIEKAMTAVNARHPPDPQI